RRCEGARVFLFLGRLHNYPPLTVVVSQYCSSILSIVSLRLIIAAPYSVLYACDSFLPLHTRYCMLVSHSCRSILSIVSLRLIIAAPYSVLYALDSIL